MLITRRLINNGQKCAGMRPQLQCSARLYVMLPGQADLRPILSFLRCFIADFSSRAWRCDCRGMWAPPGDTPCQHCNVHARRRDGYVIRSVFRIPALDCFTSITQWRPSHRTCNHPDPVARAMCVPIANCPYQFPLVD